MAKKDTGKISGPGYIKTTRALKEAERTQKAAAYAVREAERLYKHGQNTEKYDYARDYLRGAGYKLSDESAKMFIEAEVLKYKLEREKAAKEKRPARDEGEFIEKYYKKRFTPANAGKAYLLSFLYDVYSGEDRKIKGSLWNIEALKEKIKTEEDARSFDAYYHLTEWLRCMYENSRTAKNSLQSFIWAFDHIAGTIVSAENARRLAIKNPLLSTDIKPNNNNPDLRLSMWMETLSLEYYGLESDGRYIVMNLRDNIEEGLRYMVAYHAFIDVIAEFTGIPECLALKVKNTHIQGLLSSLNETLEILRKDIGENRKPEQKPALKSVQFDKTLCPLFPPTLTFFDAEGLEIAMEIFSPVEEAQPIPEERIKYLRDYIKRDFKTGTTNWYVLYTWYSINYRNPLEIAVPETRWIYESKRKKAKENRAEEGK